jgi:sn-glycerol 3-phosphate transport system permease protein
MQVLILIFTGALSALILAFAFWRAGRSILLGAAIGGIAGVVGPLAFMLPLGFCTFEPERKPIDVAFGILLCGVGAAIALLIARWLTVDNNAQRVSVFPAPFRSGWAAYVLLLPTIILIGLFLFYPSIATLNLSTQLALANAPRTRPVCVSNFTALAGDADFQHSLIATFSVASLIVEGGIVVSLLIAMLASQNVRGAAIYRSLLIWPYAISPTIIGLLFFLMFNPVVGAVNAGLKPLLNIAPPWLTDPSYAPFVVIVASIWKMSGFNILFYIAGLKNVPRQLLDAAAIDGADVFQRFWYITVPMLGPITLFLIITNISYAFFDLFGLVAVLTDGGPSGATSILTYQIYNLGFIKGNLGMASAQSIVLFIMIIGLTLFQFWNFRQREGFAV